MDMAKKGSSEFETLNQEPVGHRYLQVSHRAEGPDGSLTVKVFPATTPTGDWSGGRTILHF